MTADIAIVLSILVISLVLFVTGKVRMDVTALLVLAALALTGVLDTSEAVSGFSNPAVITVWAMFILSEGLANTGVANIIGRYVLRFTGKTESRMIFVIMLTSGSLSAVMNNIGVAALMLPVVLKVARETDTSPSKLLMPLAYGSLLGGLTTLIGTPPNLLISDALRQNNLEPFGLFDFTPIGTAVMIGGIAFVAFSSRFILPDYGKSRSSTDQQGVESLFSQYELGERTFFLKVSPNSVLSGKSLIESQLGKALGFRVIALQRNGETIFTPDPDSRLQSGDRLLTQGQAERLAELQGWQKLVPDDASPSASTLLSPEVSVTELTIAPDSFLVGNSVQGTNFRNRFDASIILIRQQGEFKHRKLAQEVLHAGDKVLVQCKSSNVEQLKEDPNFSHLRLATKEEINRYTSITERLFEISIPADSWLVGKAIKYSQLRLGFDLHVIKIQRQEEEVLLPRADEILQAGDRLTLHGRRDDLQLIRSLQELEIQFPDKEETGILESEDVGLAEATLSPKSKIVGHSLADIQFSEKYGLQILGIQKADSSYRAHLGNKQLQFGDSFLLMGPKEKLSLLEKDPDFIFLSQVDNKAFQKSKSILATCIMIAVLIPVFFGWYSIAITAVTGAALMVLCGCLKMEEAYRAIEWKSVFLIAGMLPLGTAIEKTGAAELLATGIMSTMGDHGPWIVIGSLYVVTAIATTIIPTSALVVLMSPIVLKSCADLGISPQSGMMAIALAASASFTSPISHPANILVMGPGGYRFVDYIKVGAPLALVVFIISMITLPIFWPL